MLLGRRRVQSIPAEHRLYRLRRPGLDRLARRQLHGPIAPAQLAHRRAKDGREGLEHACALRGHRRERRHVPDIQLALERVQLDRLGQVALVVLEDERNRVGIQLVREQVGVHLLEALRGLSPAVGGRVRDEDDPVGGLEHDAAGGRVHRLSGHRQQLEPDIEPAETTAAQRQQIAEDGPVLHRVYGDELTASRLQRSFVEHAQVRGLAAERRAVVHDFDPNRPVLRVDVDHSRAPASRCSSSQSPRQDDARPLAMGQPPGVSTDEPRKFCCWGWWPGTELNRRHADFQSAALPAELPGQQANANSNIDGR